MVPPKGWLLRLRALVLRRAAERELDDELGFHLEQETAKNIRLGMSPAEARRRALVALGGVQRTKDAYRDARDVRWLEELAADTRYTLRTLRRNPVFAAAAIITLALGVGANTAVFSAVNAVILRPLPFPQAGRLVMLWEENPEKGWYKNVAAPANVLDWREQVKTFQDVAAYNDGTGRTTLTTDAGPQLLSLAVVTGNFFSTLGVRAELGRAFRDDETWDNGTRIVVVSHRLWRDRFASDPTLVGRTIQLDGRGAQVVGIIPERFAFPAAEVDVWYPTAWKRSNRAQTFFRRAHWLRVIARVRAGVPLETANAQLQTVVARLKSDYPQTNKLMGAGMTPLQEFLVGDTRLPLLVLLSGAALLLLIACANVGNLLLVQAAGREREVALRLALGAGHARLVRQVLTESLVLAGLSGAVGLGLGVFGTRALRLLQPAGMLPVNAVDLDWSVLAYTLAITTASGMLFGLAPALWSGRRAPVDALKEGGRGGSGGKRMHRWGDTLVVSEVALALMLTLGAGLLVRSFWRLQQVQPGFDAAGVLTASLELTATRYDSSTRVLAFQDQLLQRVRALPSVTDVGATSTLPLVNTGYSSDFTVAGRAPGEYGTEVLHRDVTPDYFRTMRVPLLKGRVFTSADRTDAPPVVVINEALAQRYFRGQDPVGQRITFAKAPDSTSVWETIVGVVGSEHQTTLALSPQIEAYAPFSQETQNGMTLVVRTTTDPAAIGPAIRGVVAALDPALPIVSMQPMSVVTATSLARQRFLTTLVLVFAGVGLVLAVIGVYAVMTQLAKRRTREMGIRIALGAQASDVRWLIVRHGVALTIVGLVGGIVAALYATRGLMTLLYEVRPADPLTYVAVPALLIATALIASWVPARQASRADPATTLRAE